MWLREYRDKKGLTQKEVSDAMGWESAQFISNIERKQARVPAKQFKKLSAILDCPIKVMIDYECEMHRIDVMWGCGVITKKQKKNR